MQTLFNIIFQKSVIPIYITLLLTSCVKYSPYEVTVSSEEADQTVKNLEKLSKLNQDGDTIKIAFIGDTQRFYDESIEFVDAINDRNDVEFVVISGDLTDFGLDAEFTELASILKKLKVPYLTVIGNHDLVYNGKQVYQEMFGPMDYSFYFKRMKFVMINNNSREFEFNGEVPNIPWIDQQLSDTASYTQAIVIGHIPPDHSDFDRDLEIPFAQTLSKWKKTILALNGHTHNFKIDEPYGDGITYITSHSMNKNFYLLLRIWPGGFDFQNVSL